MISLKPFLRRNPFKKNRLKAKSILTPPKGFASSKRPFD